MGRHLDPHGFLRCGIFSRCRFGRQDGLDIHPVDPGQVVSHIRHGQTGVHSGQIGIHGGVGPAGFAEWLAAGANGLGLGSTLYRPGDTAAARAFASGDELIYRLNLLHLL